MQQTDAGSLVAECRAGQHRQGEDIQVIGVERQGEVEPLAEAIQAIAGQAVDQVKAEGGAGIVQQHHLAPEILTIKRPPDPAGHIRIGALQADLQGAGQFSEQLGLLLVQQFVTHLEVEMDAGAGRGSAATGPWPAACRC